MIIQRSRLGLLLHVVLFSAVCSVISYLDL